VSEHRPDPSAHVCLGVLAFKRGSPASSEYHLKRALEIDPWSGSRTDLGALYSHVGRYTEAESELQEAVASDWYDATVTGTSQEDWRRQTAEQPIRLLITCRCEGYEPWLMPYEVTVEPTVTG
jgi:hypothetical protein